MEKTFEIKVYTLAGAYVKTIGRTNLMRDFNYTASINQGQGNAEIELNLSIGSIDFALGQIVKVYIYTNVYPSGKIIYSGMITKRTGRITSGGETLTLSCIGIGSLLSLIYFKSGGSYTPTLNQEPATTLKAVVDYFNTQYTGTFLNYGANVSNFGSSINLAYSYAKCLDVIRETAGATTFWWNIRATGELYFKAVGTTPNHILTVGKDIDTLVSEQDSEKITNEYILAYTGGTTTNSDATSKTNYGLRETYENKTEFQNLASANIAGTSYISKNKNFKKKTSITINNSYNIESIEVGDIVSVVNTDMDLKSLQIYKINYNINSMTVELSEFDTLAKEILN